MPRVHPARPWYVGVRLSFPIPGYTFPRVGLHPIPRCLSIDRYAKSTTELSPGFVCFSDHATAGSKRGFRVPSSASRAWKTSSERFVLSKYDEGDADATNAADIGVHPARERTATGLVSRPIHCNPFNPLRSPKRRPISRRPLAIHRKFIRNSSPSAVIGHMNVRRHLTRIRTALTDYRGEEDFEDKCSGTVLWHGLR